jgi:prolyl-tRNA editing enzyme YbaK/EbsC (Cys-tRNA(Pro) deacylase)
VADADEPLDLPPSARRVADAAASLGIPATMRAFPEGTRTAADAARAVGCEVGQIVKSLVFLAGGEPVLALVAGDHRLDEGVLARLAGVEAVRRASAEEVRAATSYAVGGVPPFGHPAPLRAWIDRTLLDHREVWVAGGTPHHVFPLDPATLVAAGARPADLAAD